ncbi:hypothetical protein DL96DRAFT_1574288 [Flagelloscypha sp. PMI_526]|nr:hypothetical protein DL96DRAFT_1574288 [Flagelloscypha sp. PMI_526]
MSFGQWKISSAEDSPLPSHLLKGTTSNLDGAPDYASPAPKPYGTGDNDNYNLVFPDLEAFLEWRNQEEDSQMVEFVKGDTHGSKAVPPRFKEHVKLVCARHQRSGRKKYVKKYPDRVRKVPSRKLEGTGCPASISYKTYFDKDEVRACYNSQHSHEVGLPNLPYTRRGRKQAATQSKGKGHHIKFVNDTNGSSSSAAGSTAGQSVFPAPISQPSPTPSSFPSFSPFHSQNTFNPPPPPLAGNHERWENMQSLFNHIRDNARTIDYPAPSVAALETVLIRLYLESPVTMAAPAQPMEGVAPMSTHHPMVAFHTHEEDHRDEDGDEESNDGEDDL